MNRLELQALARIRLAEARALLKIGYPDGAYHLAGYSVECGLKACIAKSTKRFDFPDKRSMDASHTHNLRDLVKVANLELLIRREAERDPIFAEKWELIQQWSEHSRYRRYDEGAASALVSAIGDVKHGVMQWIKQHW